MVQRRPTTYCKTTYYGRMVQAGADLRLRRLSARGGASALQASVANNMADREHISSSTGSLDGAFHGWIHLAVNLTFDVRLY